MFYDKFKQLCDKKGVSCNKAAIEIGLSNATPTTWKKRGLTPKADTLSKIADYFGVTTDYLLGVQDEKPANKLTDPSPELVADVIKKLAASITEKEKPTGNTGGLDYSDMELLEAFQRADDSTREAIRLLLKLK